MSVSTPVVVRPAVPAEYDLIGELTAVAYLDDGLVPDGSDYADDLRQAADRAEHTELLVAQDGSSGQVLGTVSFVRPGSAYAEVARQGEAEFRMLAVSRQARGRGVGRALALACVQRAVSIGASRLVISTATTMAPAHRLYESLGFVRLPERDWEPLPGVLLMAYELVLTSDRPSGDRPSGDRPSGDRPSGDRPSGDRPSGDQPSGDQPSGDQPSGEAVSGRGDG